MKFNLNSFARLATLIFLTLAFNFYQDIDPLKAELETSKIDLEKSVKDFNQAKSLDASLDKITSNYEFDNKEKEINKKVIFAINNLNLIANLHQVDAAFSSDLAGSSVVLKDVKYSNNNVKKATFTIQGGYVSYGEFKDFIDNVKKQGFAITDISLDKKTFKVRADILGVAH